MEPAETSPRQSSWSPWESSGCDRVVLGDQLNCYYSLLVYISGDHSLELSISHGHLEGRTKNPMVTVEIWDVVVVIFVVVVVVQIWKVAVREVVVVVVVAVVVVVVVAAVGIVDLMHIFIAGHPRHRCRLLYRAETLGTRSAVMSTLRRAM